MVIPKVLVIDDSRLVHALLEDGLSGEGLEHLHADNAQEGFWYAKRAQPDLILLDVVMPSGSGFELCKQLKHDSATSHIPVIFLSGAADSFNKVQGLDLGAIDYITKPFDQAELLARVRAALRTKRLVDLLAEQAQVDALTGLHNRKFLQERLDSELLAARRFDRIISLILLDVDHFKRCNDNYGHPFGDRVLQNVAEVIQKAVRTIDLPCRYGGEEFAVILPETDLEGAVHVADRIRTMMESLCIAYRGERISVTISGGVASTSGVAARQAITREHLIQVADETLYRAKQAGRNRVLVNEPAAALTDA